MVLVVQGKGKTHLLGEVLMEVGEGLVVVLVVGEGLVVVLVVGEGLVVLLLVVGEELSSTGSRRGIGGTSHRGRG